MKNSSKNFQYLCLVVLGAFLAFAIASFSTSKAYAGCNDGLGTFDPTCPGRILNPQTSTYDPLKEEAEMNAASAKHRVFIKSGVGNYWLNHTIASRAISLADQPYNSATGAYDGELWEIVDAGSGKVFIKSANGNYWLNHTIASRAISLADQPYNSTTGAYDGELWKIVDAGGGKVFIKSGVGNYWLNHTIASRAISLADQPYNSTTGAYDGELWQIVKR